MKILLLGKDGQVGWELQRALAPLGHVVACDQSDIDLSDGSDDFAGLRKLVRAHVPDVLVNAAAYTAVDRAEAEVDKAAKINAVAPGVMAEEMQRLGGLMVHYSTDYVFDGSKAGAYVEADATAPLSVYGRTKRDGELAVQASACKHLIFRTSWVYAARGANFAKTMLRLAAERDELKVVADQMGAPTSAELIADVTGLCICRMQHDAAFAKKASGLYHLVAAGETSWCDYARYVVAEAGKLGAPLKATPDHIHAIPTRDYPTPARRPLNSRLATDKLTSTFDLSLPDWRVHARRLLMEIV